jgi:hypothetical protein
LTLPILPENDRRRASENYHVVRRTVEAVGMKQAYIPKRFHESSLTLIATMNAIADDYRRQGFKLSVRQMFYQLVTRNEVANSEGEYNRIIRLCSNARLAGLMAL